MFKIFVLLLISLKVNDAYEIEYTKQFDSPWYALLDVDKLRCGGSLYHSRFIITAAHCFDELLAHGQHTLSGTALSRVKATFGEWKTETDPDCQQTRQHSERACQPIVVRDVSKVLIHPKYLNVVTIRKHQYDIAVMKIVGKVRLSKLIANINLPVSKRCAESVVGEKWMFTGFGQIPGGEYAVVKKKHEMEIIPIEEGKMLSTRSNIFYQDTHVSGKHEAAQTCNGDSGSPVTRKIDKLAYLEGMVVFGDIECRMEGYPTGLLKIACFTDWIKNVTTNNFN